MSKLVENLTVPLISNDNSQGDSTNCNVFYPVFHVAEH